MSRRFIALIGYAGAGKDAIAAALGWPRVAFADAIKRELDPLFPPDCPKELKRPAYVALGVAWRQAAPGHWIRRIELPEDGPVCLTDLRYFDEAAWVVGNLGHLFYVRRTGIDPANDEEARSIDEVLRQYGPYLIINDGTPADAARKIIDVLDRVQ